MRNDFETVMKTSSLHFLCWLKENEAKERAFRGGEKNPVHYARQLAERRNPLRSHRSAPLPCYGKRIFSVTPQVGEITTEFDANFGNGTLPKYSFNAKELDEETGMYYYEARYYKPPVFTSRDAMFEKYFWMTPYAYCANNPVKYVDPTGMDTLVFSQNGYFEKKLPGGNNIGMIKGSDGTYATKFIFADERWCERFVSCSDEDINDKNMDNDNIQNKTFYYNKVQIVNSNCIEEFLEQSGVNNKYIRSNLLSALKYAYYESRGGEMDFVNNDKIQKKGNGQLYITTVNGKSMAHDPWNFGNFLWGAAMRRLGIPPIAVWIGSNYDCLKNTRKFDSMDDQRSIRQGYLYSH